MNMKKSFNVFGTIVFVAMVGLSMSACGDGGNGGAQQPPIIQPPPPPPGATNPFEGQWNHMSSGGGWVNNWTLTFTATHWTLTGMTTNPQGTTMPTNENGGYTHSGNQATLFGTQAGTATISGASLTLMIFGETYTFNR